MRVLLDTQVFLDAYTGDAPLSRKAKDLLANPGTIRLLSSLSIMEIALKHGARKLKMGLAETREAIRDLRLEVIDFTQDHALGMYDLPLHHRDPFDRMLIATALVEDIPLVGSDRQFKKYKGLKVIW
jgi:PIN domain nuclease of toxin-antitoxin system